MLRRGRTRSQLRRRLDSGWTASAPNRRLIEVDPNDGGDSSEVDVGSQQCRLVPQGYRGDHAVDHATGSDARSTAATIDSRCGGEVSGGIEVEQRESKQESAQIGFTIVGPGAGDDLHDHRLRHSQWAVPSDQVRQPLIDLATGRSVVFHPGGSVRQNHEGGGLLSAGTFPMACAPRMASASSRVMGCPAKWRNARSTASVLVRTP